MMEQAGHSRSGSNTRPATTMGGGDTTSDVSGMLKKYKIVILGEQSTGKTSLITRFVYDSFDSAYQTTIGIDFLSKTMYMDDRTIRLQLWDTAGQERFRTLIPSYIRDSAVVIIVYDVTVRSSFEAVEHWINEVHRERGEDVIIALVGNKSDLMDMRAVSPAEGEAKARSLSATLFLETSAKSGSNVRTLFTEIAGALNKLEPAGQSENLKANLIDVKLQADFFDVDDGSGGGRRGDRRSVSRLGRRSLSRTHGGRPSRQGPSGSGFGEVGTDGRTRNRWMGWWPMFYTTVTCCCPNFLLSKVGGMNQASKREAWREKVALCVAIAILCGALAFLTFGFSLFVCQPPINPVWKLDIVRKATDPRSRRYFIIHGQIYNIPENEAKKLHPHSVDVFKAFATQDISAYFPFSPTCPNIQFACRNPDSPMEHCHKPGLLNKLNYIGEVAYEWKDIEYKKSPYVVYNGEVLDLSVYLDQVSESASDKPFGNTLDKVLRQHLGKDASRALSVYDQDTLDCLFEHFRAGLLDVKTMGCVATDIVLYVSLVVILSLVFAKFFLAIGFAFVMSRRLGRPSSDTDGPGYGKRTRRGSKSEWGRDLDILTSGELDENEFKSKNGGEVDLSVGGGGSTEDGNLIASALKSSRYAAAFKKNGNGLAAFSNNRYSISQDGDQERISLIPNSEGSSSVIPPLIIKPRMDSTNSLSHMYTILLVTCYSEDEAGLRVTLDSLTSSDYDDNQKLLFVVADGIIKGSGNDKSTPDMLIGMMEMATDLFEPYFFDADGHPIAHSYVAIADGTKRHNMARAYPGYYRCGLHRVPMILVVKCGTPAEADKPKPGNRGKRDSQIIIMSFLNKCLFDDRMTPLDYDLFYKITRLTGGVTPENYELILMVDADTKVMPSALAKLVQVMRSDETIMGCCGETRIANKAESWVTAIQVFEYYISHHLSKAFESIFGGVTCLPGCFCMYRIKAPKGGKNSWVPIVANPEIVDAYSENVTDTLHKRNLLLLGEDRYLTTLMLKTFPRRKLIFVPQAICKTMVPNEFRVLLSQRRRWINSTVHNLFELVLVNDLCGTFCCSMQFVVFIELIGTLVLPAAITFTGVLIASTFMSDPQWIPLFLLAAILGLPALLILFTARHPVYVIWFIVYLLALPVWNFVLPVYAYWHMDDFSWGETRKVEGAGADDHGKSEGIFDASHIFMKRWHEFETERLKKAERFGRDATGESSEHDSEKE